MKDDLTKELERYYKEKECIENNDDVTINDDKVNTLFRLLLGMVAIFLMYFLLKECMGIIKESINTELGNNTEYSVMGVTKQTVNQWEPLTPEEIDTLETITLDKTDTTNMTYKYTCQGLKDKQVRFTLYFLYDDGHSNGNSKKLKTIEGFEPIVFTENVTEHEKTSYRQIDWNYELPEESSIIIIGRAESLDDDAKYAIVDEWTENYQYIIKGFSTKKQDK